VIVLTDGVTRDPVAAADLRNAAAASIALFLGSIALAGQPAHDGARFAGFRLSPSARTRKGAATR
jgi:hypothetical protein